MRIIKSLDKNEIEQALESFYEQFETGFDFEDFLKPFLESLGLSEVQVTKKTGDGGIDLHAVLHGVMDGLDDVMYHAQAKRYKPSRTIPPSEIDKLRGNLQTNEKGLFITTAKVSEKAKEDGIKKDPNRPVIVIDGKDLMNMLIDKEIGFSFKPVFTVDALKDYINKNVKNIPSAIQQTSSSPSLKQSIKKTITANDIRARIISIPSGIIKMMEDSKTKRPIEIVIDGTKFKVMFIPGRNNLSSVTDILKKYELIKPDGTFEERDAYWETDGKTLVITFNS